jgi:hypothetical protein
MNKSLIIRKHFISIIAIGHGGEGNEEDENQISDFIA